MHTAAKTGNEYTMEGLVELGAHKNIKDKDGVSETLIRAHDDVIFYCGGRKKSV